MTDSLAKLLIANGLQPDSFTSSDFSGDILRGEIPAGRIVPTWTNLAGGFPETKYWPIIRGGLDDVYDEPRRDVAEILAAVPLGGIREILRPRMLERMTTYEELLPELTETSDMDQFASLADAAGIFSFGGRKQDELKWPSEAPDRVTFHTLQERKGKPVVLLLIRAEHPSHMPAYLDFGGWNDAPAPEMQVAVLREWKNEYRALPACITDGVIECVVVKPPQTQAEALKLAAEQWIFCDDIVGQGTQSVRNLAMEIWRSPNWFFWWD